MMTIEKIVDYVLRTPGNTNPNVLKPMLLELEKNGDIDTSDATITAEDVLYGKIGYGKNGEKILGNFGNGSPLTGVTIESSDLVWGFFPDDGNMFDPLQFEYTISLAKQNLKLTPYFDSGVNIKKTLKVYLNSVEIPEPIASSMWTIEPSEGTSDIITLVVTNTHDTEFTYTFTLNYTE